MKKMLAIFTLTAIISAALSGCAKQHTADDDGESEKPVDMGAIHYIDSTESETFLVGLDGKNIKASEIKYLKNKNYEPTNILDENDFGHAECIGFAYAFKPSVYFDSTIAPDKFSSDGYSYTGEDTAASSEFIRVNVGDKFGDLTVKSARCVFSNYNVHVDSDDYLGYEGSEIELDGEITLRGRLYIPPRDPKYPGMVQDMQFQGSVENGLPISAEFWHSPELGFCHVPNSSVFTYTDVPEIRLGGYPDYDIDFDGLSEGDINTEVEITITNIKICYGIQGNRSDPTAELVSVKRL